MRRYSNGCLLAVFSVLSLFCIATDTPDYRAGSLEKLEPQPIYSADPQDSWNRIFFLLFTRTVELRLTDDFKGEGPFEPIENVMGNPALKVTSRTLERIESGDRAIDPLYPGFFNARGAESVLEGPRFAELKQALKEACDETTPRPPLHRALMQADAWAAYDILTWSSPTRGTVGDHARELLPLLAQFISKLALTSQEIAALPRNYGAAQQKLNLPDLFNGGGGWMEVEWSPGRLHDSMVGYRRAARVFLKPASDPKRFLAEVNQRVKQNDDPLPGGLSSLKAAALLSELLLIDRNGRVLPSPLTYELQLRTADKDGQGNFKAMVEEYDLSRKSLLSDPTSGGLIRHAADSPAYLPSSGNDFTFASPTIGRKETGPAILGNLGRRCQSCHDETTVNTFQMMQIPGRSSPPLRQLRSNQDEHAAYVADKKMKEMRFKAMHGTN